MMLIAVDGKAAGIVGVADPIKDSTPDAIRELKAAGLTDHHGHWRQRDHSQSCRGKARHRV